MCMQTSLTENWMSGRSKHKYRHRAARLLKMRAFCLRSYASKLSLTDLLSSTSVPGVAMVRKTSGPSAMAICSAINSACNGSASTSYPPGVTRTILFKIFTSRCPSTSRNLWVLILYCLANSPSNQSRSTLLPDDM